MKSGGVDFWSSLDPTLPSPKGRVVYSVLEIVIGVEKGCSKSYMKPRGVDVWRSLDPTLPSPKGRVGLEVIVAIEQRGA